MLELLAPVVGFGRVGQDLEDHQRIEQGVLFIIGIWACSATGKALGSHDHGGMVWDEITAFLLVLFLTPNNLIWQAYAFLLFRMFDIIKPPPIRYYDQKLRSGFGVMFDDLLAAFLTLLCLAAWKKFGI